MSDLEMKKIRQEQQKYVEGKLQEQQMQPEFYLNFGNIKKQLEVEAEEKINQQTYASYMRKAEEQSGLKEKVVPEQALTEEDREEMEKAHMTVRDGKKMSDKERKKVQAVYRKKQRRAAVAKKVWSTYSKVTEDSRNLLLNETKDVGQYQEVSKIEGDQRKNVTCTALSQMLTGKTLPMSVETMRNLSINTKGKKTTVQQKRRWAVEAEKIFKILLDFDLRKMKYKDSGDFLNNIGEKLAIGNLASEADFLISDYRKMVDGKILDRPMHPALLNEVDARVRLLSTIHMRNQNKLILMQTGMYTLVSEDAAKKLTDEELLRCMREAKSAADDEQLDAAEREKNRDRFVYFSQLELLRGMEKTDDNFRRGDDPEKLLEKERKYVKKKHPVPKNYKDPTNPPVDCAIKDLKKDGIEKFRRAMTRQVDNSMEELTKTRARLPFGSNKDAEDFAKATDMKHWEILKQDPDLRRQEIERYYGMLHRGRKIPEDVLKRIESRFEERFQEGLELDLTPQQEATAKHDQEVTEFKEKHRDPKNPKEYLDIHVWRGSDAVLYILTGLKDKEKTDGYNAFAELDGTYFRDYLKILQEEEKIGKKAMDAKKKDLASKNQRLIRYVNSFDLNRLLYTKLSDTMPDQVEIDKYVKIVEELQHLPTELYHIGAINDDEFLKMEARIDFVMDYGNVYQNQLNAEHSIVHALVDEEDMQDYMTHDQYDGTEIGDDMDAYDTVNRSYQRSVDLSQYVSMRQGAGSLKTPFKPGLKLEEMMPAFAEMAKKKLESVKAEMEKDRKTFEEKKKQA